MEPEPTAAQPLQLQQEQTSTEARPALLQELTRVQRRRSEFEELERRLTWNGIKERADAAGTLRFYGPWAVAPLCRALEDREQKVRIAAAESLGHLGDERAVGPLAEALRRSLVGRSARKQLVAGVFVALAAVVVLLGFLGGMVYLKIGGMMWAFFQLFGRTFGGYFKGRQEQSRMARAVTEALARIAERSPTPELAAVVPDLKAIAVDALQQEKDTRAVSRRAAERIESLTEQLKRMPLPAAAPAPSTQELPLPASSPTPASDSLPRPSE